MIDDTITVNIVRAHTILPSKAKILIGLDHDKFKERLLELGDKYLEKNKIFALLFDTTPQDKIMTEMKNYKDIADLFPNSNRIMGSAFYIGNVNEKDWIDMIKKCLDDWCGKDDYEIIEVIV